MIDVTADGGLIVSIVNGRGEKVYQWVAANGSPGVPAGSNG